MLRTYRSLVLAAALAAPLFAPPARAGISACGNINVEASAKCEAKVGAECTAQCTPVNFELACHGELQASCAGQCTATLPSCQATCEGDCSGGCKADPGSFDCEGSCKTDCEATCAGHCSGQSSGGMSEAECEGSCKATCSSECTGKCTGTPPSATCDAKCQASCQGSCSAEAHMDCQIQCQSQGYAECESRLQGGCTAECSKPEGALFCDTNYVDHGGNLAACEAAIKDFIDAHLQASASGSCSGNTCEGKAACKCSRVAPTPPTNFGAFTLAGLTALAIAARRRSRRH